MPSNYPAGYDSLANPTATDTLDSLTVPHADQHDKANDAIEAIQATLGTNPQGPAPTVRSRLEGVETLAASQITIATEQAAIATAAASDAIDAAAAIDADAEAIATAAASSAVTTATANATAAATLANDWATKTSSTVAGGEWSAKHHAQAAASSASSAATDAASAAASAASAALVYDSFDDRYLGAKSAAPTLDNDGNALVTGALYYLNTGTAEQQGMYAWDGSTWIKAGASGVSDGSITTAKLANLAVTSAKVGSGAATVGQTLVADGAGGTSWGAAASGGAGFAEIFLLMGA